MGKTTESDMMKNELVDNTKHVATLERKKVQKKRVEGGKIGNLGKLIVFRVSDKKILTFDGFNQEVSGRWSEHKRIMKKPLLEFNGAESRKIAFTMEINALHGYKPRKILSRIEKAVEKGTPYKLVIGGKRVGSNYWIIKSVSEAWNVIYSKGELVSAEVKVSLVEYV